jgi:hypothetical protein
VGRSYAWNVFSMNETYRDHGSAWRIPEPDDLVKFRDPLSDRHAYLEGYWTLPSTERCSGKRIVILCQLVL